MSEERDPDMNENTITPVSMRKTIKNRSNELVGLTSPYPTVVIV